MAAKSNKKFAIPTMERGKVDIFLLRILMLSNKKLCLKEIVERIRKLNAKKPPSRTAIYKRLATLNTKELIDFEWNKNMKLYTISEKGLNDILEFTNQLQLAGEIQ
jgi:DNA-binding PadR family transcriptional regulator